MHTFASIKVEIDATVLNRLFRLRDGDTINCQETRVLKDCAHTPKVICFDIIQRVAANFCWMGGVQVVQA